MYVVGFGARAAVPLNLMVSLVTLAFSMLVRSRTISAATILPFLPEVLGLAAGGIVSAFYGARLVRGLTSKRLVQVIGILLGGLGVLMQAEVARPFEYAAVLPDVPSAHLAAGFAIGIWIGLVSSVLGVAGGELLFPSLMFIFGADIKTAGSASILISIGVVLSGLWRYWRLGAIPSGRGRAADLGGNERRLHRRGSARRLSGRVRAHRFLEDAARLRSHRRGDQDDSEQSLGRPKLHARGGMLTPTAPQFPCKLSAGCRL
jgi:Sulfite exporter TauE/SafE